MMIAKSSIEVKNVDELMKDPPENIKQSIMDDIKKTCPYYNEDDIKLVYQQALVVDKIYNTEFYSNELEAYKNEKQEFSDNEISETYKNEYVGISTIIRNVGKILLKIYVYEKIIFNYSSHYYMRFSLCTRI